MAKQSFSVGQVLTAAQMNSLQQTAMLGGSAIAKTANYTLVAADAGTVVSVNSTSATTITVNTALFSAGDTVTIQNWGSGAITITAGTATVNTAGSLIVPQYNGGVLYFTSASAAIYFDFVQAGGGGGKVLQVVSTLKTDTFTAASNTLVDITGYSVSITPTSATSKILVLVNLNGNGTPASNGAVFSVLRGATDIAAPSSPGSRDAGFGNIYINDAAQMGSTSITVLDEPATTSALTYKVQGQNTGTSGGSFYINRTSQDGNDNNHSRTCSSITVMEIGA